MKLEEIHEHWTRDAKINHLDLSNESLNTAKLHAKYLQILSMERMKLKKLRQDKNELTLAKIEYFQGKLDMEDLKNRGWEPFRLKLLKQDVPAYLDADQDMIRLILQIGMQEEKVDTLESIMKNLSNRGFQIKNYIDWKKFENGLS